MLDFDIDPRNAKCRHQKQVPVDLQSWSEFLGRPNYHRRVEITTKMGSQNTRVDTDEKYLSERIDFVVLSGMFIEIRFFIASLE